MLAQITIPNTSLIKYTNAVLLPFLLELIPDNKTGAAAPIPIPMMIGSAAENGKKLVAAILCKIPTDAEALCNIAVDKIPTKIPKSGFEKWVIALVKEGISCKGLMAVFMVDIPTIKMEKPSMISPR